MHPLFLYEPEICDNTLPRKHIIFAPYFYIVHHSGNVVSLKRIIITVDTFKPNLRQLPFHLFKKTCNCSTMIVPEPIQVIYDSMFEVWQDLS